MAPVHQLTGEHKRGSFTARLCLLATWLTCSSAAKSCVDSAPKSWAIEQKQRYCQAASTSGWASPIECAHQARSDLKLKFEDVYLLCVDAINTAPVQCMNSLSKKEREQYGIALCTRAVSDATALCWEELSHFKGKHKIQDTSEAIRFCRELDGMGPMHCVRNAHIVLGISPALSLETCNNALMRADPDTMKDCLTQLKPHVYSSSARGSMAARDHGRKGILDMDAIDFCAAAPSEISAACFVHSADMKLAASDRLKLCYGAESQAGPAECFHKLLPKISSSAAHDASDKDMASKSIIRERITLGLELCAMAIHDGPAMCFNEGLRMTGGGIIPGDSIVNAKSSQMSRGTSVGDATSFSDTDYTLLQLCQGSTGIGPVECFRKSQSVFRPVDLSSDSSIAWYTSIYGSADHSSPKGRGLGLEMRVHLCHHAPSSAPAECGLRAPQWLAASERVHLCSGASHETVPIKCLQSIEGPSKNFHKAPKKVLGYFLENIADTDAQHTRGMIVNMCSFASSSNPLASAQCLMKAPFSLKLIDAVSLCTNVSVSTNAEKMEETDVTTGTDLENTAKNDGISASVYLSTCIRLAPGQWDSEALSEVCKGVRSGPEAQGAVSCVQGVVTSVSSLLRIGVSLHTSALLPAAAATCHAWRASPKDIISLDNNTSAKSKKKSRRQPQSTGDVGADHYDATLRCVQAAVSGLVSEGRTTAPEAIYGVCAGAVSAEPGECLARIANQWRLAFEDGADVAFCSAPGALSRFGCLLKQPPGRALSIAAISGCLEEQVYAHHAKATRAWSSNPDDGPEIKSGIRFSLDVQLYDQWSQPLVGFDNDVAVVVSLNSNNEQGAVLWGTRSNMTHNGKLHFNSLSISQPGFVEIKVTKKADNSDRGDVIVLAIFKLNVAINPDLQDTRYCTFIFRQAQCPAGVSSISAENWESEFPQESAYFSSQHFMICSACHKVITETWGINLHTSIDGSSMATYRAGVDSIWTGGRGYPSEEMSYENILELDTKVWNDEVNALKAKMANLLKEAKRDNSLKDTKARTNKINKDFLPKLQKMLKKAYYKKSLQWHPDRWSLYPLYTDAVTRAFELINEANSELTRFITDLATPPQEESLEAEKVKNPFF